jgi:hypothetical protein
MQVRPQWFSTFNESMPRCPDRANNFIVYFHPYLLLPISYDDPAARKDTAKIDRTEIRGDRNRNYAKASSKASASKDEREIRKSNHHQGGNRCYWPVCCRVGDSANQAGTRGNHVDVVAFHNCHL